MKQEAEQFRQWKASREKELLQVIQLPEVQNIKKEREKKNFPCSIVVLLEKNLVLAKYSTLLYYFYLIIQLLSNIWRSEVIWPLNLVSK